MRVSTSMMYNQGLQQMQAQSARLLQTQQQIASGRRILTPADDPVAAARALEIRQSQSSNDQFLANQAAANDRLRTTENRLTGIGDIMQYMRERTVQAGNAALGPQELGYIATDLRGQFEALLGLANSRDAQGDYVFAGYQTRQMPYAGSFGDIAYQGDDNQIAVQVSSSRYMPVSFAGSDVFGSARLPEPGVQVRTVPTPDDVSASFNVSLSTISVTPEAGVSYTIRYDDTAGDYLVTRRDADGTVTDLGAATLDPVAQTISFDGGVVFDLSGTAEDGDALQVFVGATGISVLNGSGQTGAGFDLALSATSAQPDPGVRYIVEWDDTAGDYLVTRREADGVTETALGAATVDAVAGTLSFDGLEFNLSGSPLAGDVVQVAISSLDITVDASGVGGTATSPTLALTSATPDAGVSYVLTWDDVAGDYDVIRREADGTESSVGVANYDAIGGTLSFDGIDFDLPGTPQAGDVLQIDIAPLDVFVSGAGTPTDTVSEPLTLALAPDSAEPDPGVRYIIGYSIGADGSGEFSVIRRQPGMDDTVVDATFDPDTGTLNFENSEGETVSFEVGGVPRNGDQAEIFVASRDIFANMAVLIDSLERPGPSVMADGPVAFGLDTFEMGLESVLRVRAQVGSQMTEIENLGKVGTDQGLQYASEISRLEDLDYAEAISRLSQQQVFLEAAQQTYLRVTGLSLFNYLS
ncbi:MAG: flagellar hook-associated protein FlgL [Pseudazoarcus pumilus]|nr:flagellar hook-associated protein FlgL [Pseudazoarcus pumilus]